MGSVKTVIKGRSDAADVEHSWRTDEYRPRRTVLRYRAIKSSTKVPGPRACNRKRRNLDAENVGQVANCLRRRRSVAPAKRPVKVQLMEPPRWHTRGKTHVLGSLAPLDV